MRRCALRKRKVVLLTLYENIFISRFGDRNNCPDVSSALVRYATLHLVSSHASCSMHVERYFSFAGNCRWSAQAACRQLWQMDHGQMVRRSRSGQAARFENTRVVRRPPLEGIYSWDSARCH